jgi:O-antigen ligase
VLSHPHNFYLETMLRSGVIGLVALIALTAGLLRALWRTPGEGRHRGLLGPAVLPAPVAMQLVWFITWVPGAEQGIVTGLAIALVAAGERARRRPPRLVPARGAPDWRPVGRQASEQG